MAAAMSVSGIEDLVSRVGERAGPTPWRSIPQELIDRFAEITSDYQWIHVDVERARQESPFGGTVAHGDLTLSLLDGFGQQLLRLDESGFFAGVNYGWNKVRFPAPVPAGARVRAAGELIEVTEVGGGWWQLVTRYTVEVEGSDKPAVVADAVSRLLAKDAVA